MVPSKEKERKYSHLFLPYNTLFAFVHFFQEFFVLKFDNAYIYMLYVGDIVTKTVFFSLFIEALYNIG